MNPSDYSICVCLYTLAVRSNLYGQTRSKTKIITNKNNFCGEEKKEIRINSNNSTGAISCSTHMQCMLWVCEWMNDWMDQNENEWKREKTIHSSLIGVCALEIIRQKFFGSALHPIYRIVEVMHIESHAATLFAHRWHIGRAAFTLYVLFSCASQPHSLIRNLFY